MKVKAIAKGQYKGVMKYQGEVFDIESPEEKESWMQEVNIVPLRVAGNMLPKEGQFVQPSTEQAETTEQSKTAE